MNKQDIRIYVDGIPKAQPRHRTAVRVDRSGRIHRHNYTPDSVTGWRRRIAVEAIRQRPRTPMTGPLRMEIYFRLPTPKQKDVSGQHHIAKPDLDNLEKAVMDEITAVGGYWHDDSQVAVKLSAKTYDSSPGVVIRIQELHA